MQDQPTVVVAVDFSTPSQRALDTAVKLSKQLGGQLHILHALELPAPVFSAYSFQIPDQYFETARAEARRLLERAVKEASEAGVDAEGHLSHQPPSAAIADAAKELGADLLVIGTHGHTGLKHIALGSIAERTLRLSPCNVLVVKDPGRED